MELQLSSVLRRLMKEKKISLRKLSKETGIKPSTLSGWANGVSPRDLTEVLICARHFNMSLEQFLFNTAPDAANLENFLTEDVFNGFLKVKIERVINTKKVARG